MLDDHSENNLIRICFVSHSAYMGGAERALLEAIRALRNKGITCHVLLPYEGPLCDELDKLNIAFRVVKYQPWVRIGNMPWWRRARNLLISLVMVVPTANAITRWRSTIVYTNTITIFTGALAALLTRRPHIWHIHEFAYDDHGIKFLLGEKLSLWLMDRLSVLCIAASKAIAEAYKRSITPSKLKVIYQSVSIPNAAMSLRQTSNFKCVIVGKISEGKNQKDAVNAVAELKKNGMNVELYIVGDGYEDYIARLNDIIEKKCIKNNVKFIGYCKDAFSYMCLADVMLMCSRSEGFGRVTVESMLAGKPIIGGRGGATTELIQDGIRGLLYTTGNYKELVQKIEYLYEQPAAAKLMGENARQWALHEFSEVRYGDDLMKTLLTVIKSSAKISKAHAEAISNDQI